MQKLSPAPAPEKTAAGNAPEANNVSNCTSAAAVVTIPDEPKTLEKRGGEVWFGRRTLIFANAVPVSFGPKLMQFDPLTTPGMVFDGNASASGSEQAAH
jgi:hypothetical protein